MIFFGGTGRSGKSILKNVIATHPDVADLPFELRFITDPDGLVDFYQANDAAWSPYMVDRRLKRLEKLLRRLGREPGWRKALDAVARVLGASPGRYSGWELERHIPGYERYVGSLMARLVVSLHTVHWVGGVGYNLNPTVRYRPPFLRGVVATEFGDFLRNIERSLLQGKTVLALDDTWSVLFAREILDFVPDAKFVHVIRDPRDVVASFVKQRWTPNDVEGAVRWYRDLMAYWEQRKPRRESYIEVKFEELVEEPYRVVQHVCKFVGLEYDDSVGLGTSLLIRSDKAHIGRWKHEFDEQERWYVNAILENVIVKLGYEPEEF